MDTGGGQMLLSPWLHTPMQEEFAAGYAGLAARRHERGFFLIDGQVTCAIFLSLWTGTLPGKRIFAEGSSLSRERGCVTVITYLTC